MHNHERPRTACAKSVAEVQTVGHEMTTPLDLETIVAIWTTTIVDQGDKMVCSRTDAKTGDTATKATASVVVGRGADTVMKAGCTLMA